LFFFGYASYPGREENPTGFFNFEEASKDQVLQDSDFRKSYQRNLELAKSEKIKEYGNTGNIVNSGPPPLCPAQIYSQRKMGL